MTSHIDQAVEVRVHALPDQPLLARPSTSAGHRAEPRRHVIVGIVAEHDLTDPALAALVTELGHRPVLVDLDVPSAATPACDLFLVHSSRRVAAILADATLASAMVVGIGVRVGTRRSVELPDSPLTAHRLKRLFAAVAGASPSPRTPVPLSPREREVVITYALGSTVTDTAHRHFIAESTVRSHFRRVIRRYNDAGRTVANKSQLLLALIADGWVEPARLP